MPSLLSIVGDAADSLVSRNLFSSWAATRDGELGATTYPSSVSSVIGVSATKTPIRGVGINWLISRSFFVFDVGAITHVPKLAALRIKGLTNGSSDIAVVKGNWGTGETIKLDDIYGWNDYLTSDGSGGGDQIGNVTFYANEVTTWSTSGYNNIDLNQQAKVDIAGLDFLRVALLSYDFDLQDIEPGAFLANKSGLYYYEAGSASYPTIKLTTQDDAVFFGANF